MRFLRAARLVVLLLPSVAFAQDDPLAHVRDLLSSGCHAEARDELVKACHTFQQQSDVPGEASAWLLLGITDCSMGDMASAQAEIEEAAEKFIAADDPFSAWMSLFALAETARQQGQTETAISTHERGLALLQRAADPRSRFSLAVLKVLGPVFGASTDMLGPMAAYPEVVKPILLRFASVLAHDSYGAALLETGQLERAEKQLTQANEDDAMFGGLFDAQIAMHLGDLRQRQWRLDDARASYLRALAAGPTTRMMSAGAPIQELWILERLADLDLSSGRIEEALGWNDRALALVRETRQPQRETDILQKRAGLLQKAGRYQEAVALYDQILAVAKTNANLSLEASVESDLGALHMFQGTYGTSARHLERSIELYQTLNEPFLEAPTWILLAEVDMQVGMQDGVADALANARALARKSGFKLVAVMVDAISAAQGMMTGKGSPGDIEKSVNALLALPEAKEPLWRDLITVVVSMLRARLGLPESLDAQLSVGAPYFRVMSLMIEGKLLMNRGDYEGARAAWLRGLDANPNNDIRAGLYGVIGATYLVDGQREKSIQYFAKAASTIERTVDDVKVEEMLAGYLGSNRRWYFDLLIETLVRQGNWREAFGQSERARARAFLRMVGNHRLNTERGADPRLLRETEILRNDIAKRDYAPGNARAGELIRAREHYETLLTRVKISNPEYASLTNVEPLRLEEVQNELAPDTTLISYFVSPNAVHAWVIGRGDAHYARLPIDREGLQRIVCWARSLRTLPEARGARLPGECDDAATSDEAFEWLIKPIHAWIRGPKLILIPHGVLHYVPFAALHDPATGRYLLDDFTLTYAPSASALRFLRAKESAVDGRALVLGDPVTASGRLPGAAQEAAIVARILHTTPHLGSDAREALLYDLHGTTDLVHLAAHGIYDAANPLFSRIELSSGDAHDGNLTVQDILSSVDFTGVNLVVLSACQSAVGARSGGDEVVGLTRALLYAGTPGVISTLWNIDDAASAELMQEFYRGLAGGTSVADALRQAQLAVKARYPDPAYWAAFTLNGDPQGRWKQADR
ncbi:MAG TPA: CHAT domain-containing tetratricopeptide repeat protein [Thermoanaerobaculia bacterium]|jgi:CHAT domain-containing protein|nr:CHAT domain-containing tetratricopeptide repeat protein [Thermoanaerobaculia bacterium]